VEKSSLKILLKNIRNWNPTRILSSNGVSKYFQLTLELVELFLTHYVDIDKYNSLYIHMALIIKTAAEHVLNGDWANGVTEGDKAKLTGVNIVLNGLGHIFRCFLVAGGGLITTDINWDTFIYPGHGVGIIIVIAAYSSVSGNSKKLIRLILDGMTATQINELCEPAYDIGLPTMSPQLEYLLDTTSESALELIWKTETQQRLQHLARHSVLRAVSGRKLPSALELEIPRHLREYLAFRY